MLNMRSKANLRFHSHTPCLFMSRVNLWQVDPYLPLTLALNTTHTAWLLLGYLLANHSAQRSAFDLFDPPVLSPNILSSPYRWPHHRCWHMLEAVLCHALLPAGVVLVCPLHAYRLPSFVLVYTLLQTAKELIAFLA